MSLADAQPEPDQRTLELLDKQLGRYQQIILRLAGNSVQVKTWCFTAAAALSALAINSDEPTVFAAAIILVAAFFYLDAYFLALEQHFRRVSAALAEKVIDQGIVDLRELLIIERTSEDLNRRQVIRCGAASQPSLIYLVISIALLAALIATAR